MSIWYNLELIPPRLQDADDRRAMAKFVAALAERLTDIQTQQSIIAGNVIWDEDRDTRIQVEESLDEDIIRFDTDGTERMTIGKTGIIDIITGNLVSVSGTFNLNDENLTTTGNGTFNNMTLTGDLAVNGEDITSTGDLRLNPAGNDVVFYKSGTADVTTNEYNSRDSEMLGSAWMLNAAYTWSETQPAGAGDKNWYCVASDSDGSFLIAGIWSGRLYTSSDYGVTWTERQPAGDVNKYWAAAASDSDGSNLIVGICGSGGYLYTSSNGGVDWTERQPAGVTSADWEAVASDSDGSNLIAASSNSAVGGRLYTSSDSGVNWTDRLPAGDIERGWLAVASDSDGSNLIACHDDEGSGRKLFTSSNGGANWTERQPAGAGGADWEAVASDSDGSNLAVIANPGRLYTSSDSGVNWTERRPTGIDEDKSWYCVASDSDGSFLIVVAITGRVYISSDSGVTWSEEQPAGDINKNWACAASDSDGSNVIVGNINKLYTGVLTASAETTRKITTRLIPEGNLATPKYRLGFLDNDDSEFFTLDGLNQRVGIGVVDPDTKVEILHAGTQLKLSYDATNYITLATQSDGDLTIDSNKASYDLGLGDANLLTTGTLGVGAGTFSDRTIITRTSAGAATTQLRLQNLDATVGTGARISFRMWDSNSAVQTYSRITTEIDVNTEAAEESTMRFHVWEGGSATEYLNLNGNTDTVNVLKALAGSSTITGTNFTSNIAIGTSPYACTSTTLNTNLNADLWDGYQFADYLDQSVKSGSSPTLDGTNFTGVPASAIEDKFLRNDGDDSTTGSLSMVNATLSGDLAVNGSDITSTNNINLKSNTQSTAFLTMGFPDAAWAVYPSANSEYRFGYSTMVWAEGWFDKIATDGDLTLDPAGNDVILDNANLQIQGTYDLLFKGAGTITHENADAHYTELYGGTVNTGWYWNSSRTLYNHGGTTIMELGAWGNLIKANNLLVANLGVNVGAKAVNNILDDSTHGSASTTLYIGNSKILVESSSPTLTGDWTFSGGGGLPFGEIYANDVLDEITITVAGQANKVQVTSFAVDGVSNNATPDHTNDHITIVKAGMYLCTVSMSISSAAAGGADDIGFAVYKNNGATEFANVHGHRTLGGGGADRGSCSMSGIIDLAVSDTIEVWIWNEDSTDNVVVDDITLSLTQVGGT